MGEQLCSVGLDVGTTTTQLVVSQLLVENRAGAFSVPELTITQRRVCYESPVHFTPLLPSGLIDGQRLRELVLEEYARAGITRETVDTGAVIITGETSRRENAQVVLQALSSLAGDFVVATAGPDLESILAAKGSGAVAFSAETGQTLVHMDIGGGTSNLALIENGRITATGCVNVGGRLIKMDKNGKLTYVSPVLTEMFPLKVGQTPTQDQLWALARQLASCLEAAAGLTEDRLLFETLWTRESGAVWPMPPAGATVSFSGGVADCIESEPPVLAFGDLGPLLGRAIRESRLCRRAYRLGNQTIRATVIGAGSHSTQLSGSTVYFQNIPFPLKNLPVAETLSQLAQLDGPGVLALRSLSGSYDALRKLAGELAQSWPQQPVLIALEQDMAKALGHALALQLPGDRPILCIDRVRLQQGSYLDVGAPVASALPLVVKTLVLNNRFPH